jgi:hypothetical protein
MIDKSVVAVAAQRLSSRDETALETLVGLRQRALERDPALSDDVDFEPKYDSNTMGAMDDIKDLGRRILKRWNKELCGVVCGKSPGHEKDRTAVLESLNLSEAAAIAAVAGALLSIGVVAALAAALAPLIVKRFIWPAKDELCVAWAEGIKRSG